MIISNFDGEEVENKKKEGRKRTGGTAMYLFNNGTCSYFCALTDDGPDNYIKVLFY